MARGRTEAAWRLTVFRRTVYGTSALAAVGLIGTLVWNLLDRHPLHRLRDAARL